MENVSKLPTAATSYYTVHKLGQRWAVMLVTPCGSKSLKTALYSSADRDAAIEHARETAARVQRPFKMRGAA